MTAPSPAGLSPLLDQLDEAHAKGTQGEWHVASSGAIDAGDYDTVIGRGDVDCMAHCYGGTSTIEGDNLAADAALIVAAVNALPQLTAAIRAVAEWVELWEAEAASRQQLADGLPNQPAYHMEINRLVVAAEHQRRCARQARRALIAALTPGADTAGATA